MSVPVGIHPLVNKFDQISSDNYQMSLAREGYVQRGGLVCPEEGRYAPLNRLTDRRL